MMEKIMDHFLGDEMVDSDKDQSKRRGHVCGGSAHFVSPIVGKRNKKQTN